MIYLLFIGIILLAFLFNVNNFLRGSAKQIIDLVIGIFLLGIIISVFILTNWKYGLLSFGIIILSGNLLRPLAAHVASKCLAHALGKKSNYIGFPWPPLYRISKRLASNSQDAEISLIDFCQCQSDIREIMKEYSLTSKDLLDLYNQLIRAGAGQWACGHWVAASAIAYAVSLKYLLTKKNQDMYLTAGKLISYFEIGEPLS